MKDLIVKENLKGKKLNKVSIYFRRISEKETMPGTFFLKMEPLKKVILTTIML